MKRTRKGFTLVELVVVIAVIAILAAVLIPTFAGVIEDSRNSAAELEVRNLIQGYLTTQDGNGYPYTLPNEEGYIISYLYENKTFFFYYLNGVTNITEYNDALSNSMSIDDIATNNVTINIDDSNASYAQVIITGEENIKIYVVNPQP